MNQMIDSCVDGKVIREKKDHVKVKKLEKVTSKFNNIKEQLTAEQQRILQCVTEKGASNWLTALPLKKYNFHLNKQEFRDAVFLRYGLQLSRLPTTCVCGARYSIDHALNCARGGFVIIRHNEIRDLTSDLLNIVCRDVEVEPALQPITGETFTRKTVIKDDGARLDVSARGFWTRGNKTYVDVKVFNPISKTSMNKQLKAVYKTNETMKKRCYNERILQIEHGTFTPLFFSVLGGVGFEGSRFLKRLNEMIAEKNNENLSESQILLEQDTVLPY